MAEKKYTQEKENLKKFSEKISAPIGTIKINIWKTILPKLKPFIKMIKQNPDLDEAAKGELLYFIYLTINNDVKNYVPTNIPTWTTLVQEFLESKCNASWVNYMDNYFSIFNEKIKAAVAEAKQKNKHTEEKKPEEKKDEFTGAKGTILKMLGYVPGKRGSQDSSPEIDSWIKKNISKGQRGIIINDILRAKNEREIHSLLDKSYNLAFKNNKFVRLRS